MTAQNNAWRIRSAALAVTLYLLYAAVASHPSLHSSISYPRQLFPLSLYILLRVTHVRLDIFRSLKTRLSLIFYFFYGCSNSQHAHPASCSCRRLEPLSYLPLLVLTGASFMLPRCCTDAALNTSLNDCCCKRHWAVINNDAIKMCSAALQIA